MNCKWWVVNLECNSCEVGIMILEVGIQSTSCRIAYLSCEDWNYKFWGEIASFEIVIVCWVCGCMKFEFVCRNFCLFKINLKLLITSLTFKIFLKFHVKMQKIYNLIILFYSILLHYLNSFIGFKDIFIFM